MSEFALSSSASNEEIIQSGISIDRRSLIQVLKSPWKFMMWFILRNKILSKILTLINFANLQNTESCVDLQSWLV